MQRANERHSLAHVLRVVVVKLLAPLDEARDFPALVFVLVHERVVDAQVFRHALREGFALAVDDIVGARAGVTVHVGMPVHAELERHVCQPFLDGNNARSVMTFALKYLADVVDNTFSVK